VDSLRSFVLRSSLMVLMFKRLPDLTHLFEGLRYKVEIKACRELADLLLVTVSAPIATLLPADEVLQLASAVSGRSGFVEVIDTNQAANIPDTLQDQVSKILQADHDSSGSNQKTGSNA
jgi:hypothetical protein